MFKVGQTEDQIRHRMKKEGVSDIDRSFYIVKAYHTKKPQVIPSDDPKKSVPGTTRHAGIAGIAGALLVRQIQSRSSKAAKKGPKPTKKALKPKHKMKQFHWKRIIKDPESDCKTIFSEMEETQDIDLNGEFADLFMAKETKKIQSKTGSSSDKQVKKRVFEGKRHENMAILLKSLPKEATKLREAILKMHREQITVEQIELLLDQVCNFGKTHERIFLC